MKKYYLTLNEDGSDTHICLYQEYNDRKQKVLVEFTEIEKLEQKLKKAVEALKYYAKHDHHLNTTAPNFAREALKEIGEG